MSTEWAERILRRWQSYTSPRWQRLTTSSLSVRPCRRGASTPGGTDNEQTSATDGGWCCVQCSLTFGGWSDANQHVIDVHTTG